MLQNASVVAKLGSIHLRTDLPKFGRPAPNPRPLPPSSQINIYERGCRSVLPQQQVERDLLISQVQLGTRVAFGGRTSVTRAARAPGEAVLFAGPRAGVEAPGAVVADVEAPRCQRRLAHEATHERVRCSRADAAARLAPVARRAGQARKAARRREGPRRPKLLLTFGKFWQTLRGPFGCVEADFAGKYQYSFESS